MLQFDAVFEEDARELPLNMTSDTRDLDASFEYFQKGDGALANITAESIESALGYKPVSKNDLPLIGETLKLEDGVLNVNTAEAVEEDNTRPVTSAAVYMQLGNIEALLANL